MFRRNILSLALQHGRWRLNVSTKRWSLPTNLSKNTENFFTCIAVTISELTVFLGISKRRYERHTSYKFLMYPVGVTQVQTAASDKYYCQYICSRLHMWEALQVGSNLITYALALQSKKQTLTS